MKFHVIQEISNRPEADLVIIPFFKTKKGIALAVELPDLQDLIGSILETGDFHSNGEEPLLVYLSKKREKRALFLELGDPSSCSMEHLRRKYSAAMKKCLGKKWKVINCILPQLKTLTLSEITRSISEGVALSMYVYNAWRSDKATESFFIENIYLVGAKNGEIPEKTLKLLTGVNLARDLVNGNALDVTPQMLANEAKNLASRFSKVKTTILEKKEIETEKMDLLLAVGSGSRVGPVLIAIEYRGAPDADDLTLVVGKGVTFDTGGINLKPTHFVEDMRADMGGAAAAMGLIQSAAELELKVNIVSLIPATENALDAHSYKPGDVYRSHFGKTVEITNTDAEGRLILADALSYGQKQFKPNRVIDLATLTGAIVIALGEGRIGLFSNNDGLATLCEKAGEMTGEKVWRMPLEHDYFSLIKSDIADIRNSGKERVAGSITAALFLQEFVEKEMPWIHLDIAGTAFFTRPKDYHLSQASGSGVRLLIELLECLR